MELDFLDLKSLLRCEEEQVVAEAKRKKILPEMIRPKYVPKGAEKQLIALFDKVSTIFPANPYSLIPDNKKPGIELGISGKQLKEFNVSPQIRKISPGTVLYVPVFVVPRSFTFELLCYFWETLTTEGDQDLIVRLFLGNDPVFQSGKIDSVATVPPFDDPKFVSETRTVGTIGVPPSVLTSTTGTGFPDNYPVQCSGKYGIANEQETVYFLINNQSSVYNHGIKLYIRGVVYPTKNNN